jgi:ribosomal protein S18 acetylase RimI-like enzyme
MLPEDTNRKKRSEIDIRQMEIDDLSSVYHMGEELFTSDEFPILYRTWDAYEVTDYFTSDPDYCLVAELEGKVVGFILATTVEKEGTAWKRYGYLSWIGVDEEYQRTGLAQRLYKRLEEKFQKDGVRMVIADTEADNEKAISFFKAMDFTISERYLWLGKTLKRTAQRNRKNVSSSPSEKTIAVNDSRNTRKTKSAKKQ